MWSSVTEERLCQLLLKLKFESMTHYPKHKMYTKHTNGKPGLNGTHIKLVYVWLQPRLVPLPYL